MKKWIIITVSVAAISAVAFVGLKYYQPPGLTVYSLNPMDGSGSFQWGKAAGGFGPGTFDAGWGWTGSFTGFVPGSGYKFQVMKNGAVYKTYTVNGAGLIKL